MSPLDCEFERNDSVVGCTSEEKDGENRDYEAPRTRKAQHEDRPLAINPRTRVYATTGVLRLVTLLWMVGRDVDLGGPGQVYVVEFGFDLYWLEAGLFLRLRYKRQNVLVVEAVG